MRRRAVKLVLFALVGIGVWTAWPRAFIIGEPAAAPTKPVRWMGVASCAASACHHANGPRGTKGSEYSTWAAHDKHAQAYQVLYNDRSRTMIRNLFPNDDKREAHHEPLCLKCHATGDGEPKATGPRFQLTDGVGCESCHGPAENWLAKHYQTKYKADLAELGMWPTKNLAFRASLCAGCHVGDAATGKEVNHDLYAAGHPRLNFELSAFHAQYPKHWNANDDKGRYPDFEARVWALGQVGCAEKAVELLADRAKRAQSDKAPWPEFAEYSCFACHKNLQPNSPRQKAGYGNRVPGSLPLATWPSSMTLPLAKHAKVDLKEWGTLRKEMERPQPNAAKVEASAEVLRKALDDWRRRVEQSPPLKVAEIKALQAELLGHDTPTTWDEATQLYLALEALGRAQQDLKKPPSPAFLSGLRNFRKELVNAYQIPGAPGQRVESPANFDPARLNDPLRALRESLSAK